MIKKSGLLVESAHELNQHLKKCYAEVLDLAYLRTLGCRDELSSLFLPAASDSYLRSKARVMIVGRETAGWGEGLRPDLASGERSTTIEKYIDHQMHYHQLKVAQAKSRSKFVQFYREASRKVAANDGRESADAAIWANLFCFDKARTRPDRLAQSGTEIVRLSMVLLRIQIDVLRPQLIVFATGTSCDQYLRDHFSDRFDSEVYVPRRLWGFKLPFSGTNSSESGHSIAFRTPHPRHSSTAPTRSAIIAEVLNPGAVKQYVSSMQMPVVSL